jgi:nicotinamide riboside transporter PnuC
MTAQQIVDRLMLVAIVVFVLAFLWAYTSKSDRRLFNTECKMTIPHQDGLYCMHRDYKGNIFYVRAK